MERLIANPIPCDLIEKERIKRGRQPQHGWIRDFEASGLHGY
jgi:hypothetical protein